MAQDELDLEGLWAASSDGPPEGVPAKVWQLIREDSTVVGLFSASEERFVIVCALRQPQISALARGMVVLQRGGAGPEGERSVMVTFVAGAAAGSVSPARPPFGLRFDLSAPPLADLWLRLAAQGQIPVTYVDLSEAVVVGRGTLDLVPHRAEIARIAGSGPRTAPAGPAGASR